MWFHISLNGQVRLGFISIEGEVHKNIRVWAEQDLIDGITEGIEINEVIRIRITGTNCETRQRHKKENKIANVNSEWHW